MELPGVANFALGFGTKSLEVGDRRPPLSGDFITSREDGVRAAGDVTDSFREGDVFGGGGGGGGADLEGVFRTPVVLGVANVVGRADRGVSTFADPIGVGVETVFFGTLDDEVVVVAAAAAAAAAAVVFVVVVVVVVIADDDAAFETEATGFVGELLALANRRRPFEMSRSRSVLSREVVARRI